MKREKVYNNILFIIITIYNIRISISTDPLYLTDFDIDSIMLYCDSVNKEIALDFFIFYNN